MKNTLNVNLIERTITITKSFEKKANVYGSSEYELLSDAIAKHPSFEIIVRTIAKHNGKVTHKNMTYENMRKYVELSNDTTLIAEYELQIAKSVIAPSPYHYVLTWFTNKFSSNEDYNSYFLPTEVEKESEVLA